MNILNDFLKQQRIHTVILLIVLFTVQALGVFTDSLKTVPSDRASIELKTYVESAQVPLNRLVMFHVQLSWIGDMSRYQIIDIPQPILTNLLLEGSGSENRLEPLEGGVFRSVKSINYQFRPLELGMAYIDGLVIEYRDKETGEVDNLRSQRVMVEIIDPLPDKSGRGVKAVIYIVLLVIFVATTLYFLIVYLRKRDAAKRSVEPLVSPAETCLQRLSQEIDPKGTNLTDMTGRLSKIFLQYLAKEFGISGVKEIREKLTSAGVASEEVDQLTALFEKLEIVKFAGEKIDPAEFSRIYGTIEKFLHEQKQQWEIEQEQLKEK